MRIGRRDSRITLQRYTETRNAYNEIVKAWSDVATVWAHVKTQSGKEALQSGQVLSSQTAVFNIRYQPVTTKDRIVYEGKTYDVESVNVIGRKKELELIAHEQGI